MGKGEKVVIDTNVFISAFGWGGKPLKIIELSEQEKIINCISEEILDELLIALSYPKLGFSKKLQSEVLKFILAYSDVYESKEHISIASDNKDNKFIECALSANAGFIITGDKSILSIKQFRGVKIATPEGFLKIRKSVNE